MTTVPFPEGAGHERGRTLMVSEVFGPTFQGEGPSLGQRAGFVRLGRCNLDCGTGPGATWACDTPYTWDWDNFSPDEELQPMDVEHVVDKLAAMAIDLVVLTGGEPLLQQRKLPGFLAGCAAHDLPVEVETNGTIVPHPDVVAGVRRFNVSPKLPNSGVPVERALRPDALAELARLAGRGQAVFKFVAADRDDLDDIATVVNRHRLDPVWVMPAGTTAGEILACQQALADPVLARGWRLTTRLHVLLWGDERGR